MSLKTRAAACALPGLLSLCSHLGVAPPASSHHHHPSSPLLFLPAVGNSKCSKQQRAQITVKPGSTTRVRLINAASLVYMTVCFEKHSVTVIALDGSPIEPKTFPDGCADVNTGQRCVVFVACVRVHVRSEACSVCWCGCVQLNLFGAFLPVAQRCKTSSCFITPCCCCACSFTSLCPLTIHRHHCFTQSGLTS